MNFGEKLKISIKKRGYTQTEFANEIYVTHPTLNKWCNNKCEPSIEYIRIMCSVLDISADWLLGIKNEE